VSSRCQRQDIETRPGVPGELVEVGAGSWRGRRRLGRSATVFSVVSVVKPWLERKRDLQLNPMPRLHLPNPPSLPIPLSTTTPPFPPLSPLTPFSLYSSTLPSALLIYTLFPPVYPPLHLQSPSFPSRLPLPFPLTLLSPSPPTHNPPFPPPTPSSPPYLLPLLAHPSSPYSLPFPPFLHFTTPSPPPPFTAPFSCSPRAGGVAVDDGCRRRGRWLDAAVDDQVRDVPLM